jgi:hypothetical protein
MAELLPLDAYLDKYHQGELERKEFEGIIFEFILENAKRYHLQNWPKDECIDFLCWLYPRISRAVDKYRKEGASFDAYVGSMVRWAAREYIHAEQNHKIIEQTYWDGVAQDMMVCSREPVYDQQRRPLKPVPNPRQMLVLLLKSYYFVSDDFAIRVAPAIGMQEEALMRLINKLRRLRMEREEVIKSLRERIYIQYYRCISLEKRMNSYTEGSLGYAKCQIRLERTRKRLANMRKRFKLLRLDPSNLQLAQVLGLPKGTIDSNLFAIKANIARSSFKPNSSGRDYDEDPTASPVLGN